MSANFRYLIAAVLITFLSFNTLGCNNNTPQKKPTETQETEKPPPELEKMKKSLAELGTMLEKRRSPEVEVALEAEKGGQGNQEGGESEGDGGQQNQKGGQQAKALSREWQEEMELVRNLHREWNGLEPEAVSKGMSNATQEALETNLFDLTRAIESRQALEAQLATNPGVPLLY